MPLATLIDEMWVQHAPGPSASRAGEADPLQPDAGNRKMPWTSEQSAALKLEYTRIGYRAGEHWPAPTQQQTPDELLALLRSVKTGAGLQGYLEVLRSRNP